MNWDALPGTDWTKSIDNLEQKQAIARELAAQARDGQVIGIGSGSSAYLALLELAKRVNAEGLAIECVVTSLEIEAYCTALGLPVGSLVNRRPDWCFDGADEVDPDMNMIKGRGGAFVREQLVFASAVQRFILIDDSKHVPRLGTHHALPLGVFGEATSLVRQRLRDECGLDPVVRAAGGKDGGVIDEHGLSILDLAIDDRHSPAEWEAYLLGIPGIAATGLFIGYQYEILS